MNFDTGYDDSSIIWNASIQRRNPTWGILANSRNITVACDFSWYQIVIAVVELRAAQYWDFRIENGFSFTKLSHKVIVKVIN